MRGARAAAVLLGLAAPVALTAACGARSGLFLPSYLTPIEDAAVSSDVALIDDVFLPPLDATPRDVVPLLACADASDTLIYNVTTDSTGTGFQLLKFNPGSAQFTVIAPLVCPDPYSPFSMAVDRQGNAYVLYYGEFVESAGGPAPPPGNIYRVDLNTGDCEPTGYIPSEIFQSFGMGFVSDDVGTGETLYIASNDNEPTGILGAIDETSLGLTNIGPFTPTVSMAELTGTGDGRLFAFWAPGGNDAPGSAISQIDKTNANVIAQVSLPTVTQGSGWAFAFYGGNFYLFTNPAGVVQGGSTETIVQQYNPTTGAVTQVATYPQTIVGAGVSTCAPVK